MVMANSLSSIRLPTFHSNSTSSTAINTITALNLVGHVGNASHLFASPLQVNVSGGASTEENEEEKNPWSFEFSVVMATILSISAFLNVVGNAMVLTVIIRHRGMRTRTNLFLVNLAIADFLVGLMLVPFSITTLVEGRWMFGELFCSVNGWMNGLCLITSIHTLMYIGINKYYSICRPLNNPIQLKHIVVMMVMAWLWGAFCATITVTGLNTVSYKYGTSQCGPDYPKEFRGYVFHGIVQVTVIILPFCILLFCYIRMFREIKRHSERLRSNTTVEEDFILNQQKKVAVTLFIVLATFIVMALPYHIYATYTTIKKDKDNFSTYMNPIAYCFLYLNSMCNPIIYAFRSPAFREGYKEILCQTPSYVIRDDSNINQRACRGGSLVPSGRSRLIVSSSSTASNADNTESPEVHSPTPLLFSSFVGKSRSHGGINRNGGNTTAKPKRLFNLQKQQTMKEMIRSSRKSSGPLVIRRDGDVVVVKSGKIVSVRRESDSSSGVLSPRRLGEVREVPYGNSIAQMVFSQLTLGATPAGNEKDGVKNKDLNQTSDSNSNLLSRGSEKGVDGSGNFPVNSIENENGVFSRPVFEEEEKDDSESDSPTRLLLGNGVDTDIVSKSHSTDVNGLPKDDSYHSIKELSTSAWSGDHLNSNSKRERLKDRRNAPDLTVQIYKDKREVANKSSSLEHLSPRLEKSKNSFSNKNNDNQNHGKLAMPTLSNMAAGVASATTDILLGMPLTPFTRNILTQSDQQLNRFDPRASPSRSSFLAPPSPLDQHRKTSGASSRTSSSIISHAHSSDNLYRPTRIARYPSLEHLDRPKPLFGTSKFHTNKNDKMTIV